MDKTGIYDEQPEPTDVHVNNYLEMLGAILKQYRVQHPIKGRRNIEAFATRCISKYFSRSVSRALIRKAESGNYKASVGVYAAILHEMEAWPEIIDAISSGKNEDVQYVRLVLDEIRKKEAHETKERMKALSENYFNYIG